MYVQTTATHCSTQLRSLPIFEIVFDTTVDSGCCLRHFHSWTCAHIYKKWVTNLPLPWNLRSGFTIATNRSSDIATSVNTDTPVEKSFINSDILHMRVPQGHDSTVYTTDTNGTAVNMSMRSAIDSDIICLLKYENEKCLRKKNVIDERHGEIVFINTSKIKLLKLMYN